jgi:hydroxyacylglutathione hydrolase
VSVRIDHAVVSGTFSLDGQTFDVDNNIWVLGDDERCVVIDAPHDVDAIMRVVGDRTVEAILLTHAHDDHVRVAPALAERTGAELWLHPDDLPLWRLTHPDLEPDADLVDGARLALGGTTVEVLHTPGHAPGACCFAVPDLGVVFTGDTLFKGGPGATGRSFSDFPTIIESITRRLLSLPPETVVHPGHGESTTVGEEAPHREEWIRRGY